MSASDDASTPTASALVTEQAAEVQPQFEDNSSSLFLASRFYPFVPQLCSHKWIFCVCGALVDC